MEKLTKTERELTSLQAKCLDASAAKLRCEAEMDEARALHLRLQLHDDAAEGTD